MKDESGGVHTHPIVSAIGEADAAIAGVRDAAFFGLSDDDLEVAIGGCEQLRARLFDTALALVAEADGRDLGRRLGASSTASWLRDRYRIRPGDARRLVDLANRTCVDDGPIDHAANVRGTLSGRELVATGAALANGEISPEHVAVVGKVMKNLPRGVSVEQAQQAERDMAGFCREHDPAIVAKLGDYMLYVLAGDTLDEREADKHRRRNLRFDEASGGVFGTLTAEGMALLRTALDPLAAPVPGEDGSADPRSAGQRLADALVEMARRAIAADSYSANHGVSHRVMLTIGLDTLTADHDCTTADATRPDSAGSATRENTDSVDTEPDTTEPDIAGRAGSDPAGAQPREAEPASIDTHTGEDVSGCPIDAKAAAARAAGGISPGELTWGGHISAAAARRLACFAGIQRVILDPMGAVLDVGREYRTVTPAQFIALIARDGGCAFPGCTQSASWCIAHHIKHWADGGNTDLDNLVLLCTFHHTVVHHRGWDIKMSADRLPAFYPPTWVDPDRGPRRNTRPRLRPPPGTSVT